jgi:hypothetical protein
MISWYRQEISTLKTDVTKVRSAFSTFNFFINIFLKKLFCSNGSNPESTSEVPRYVD